VMDIEKEAKEKISKIKFPLYMDWGMYDARFVAGGWDLRKANSEFYAYLKQNGISVSGGETHEGYGWGNWRNRNDRVLMHLFPIAK